MKTYPWIILGLVLIVLSSMIPLRMSSFSEIELGQLDKLPKVDPQRKGSQHLTESDAYFGTEKTALTIMLQPPGGVSFDEKFPRLGKEVLSWVKWQQGRRAQMLFPVEDSRGAPTLALIRLSTLLYAEKRFSGTFASQWLEARDLAPDKKYGKVEDVLMGVLVLASKLNFSDLSKVLASVDSIETLNDCAGLFQRIPNKKDEFIKVHAHTPVSLMPKLYERVTTRGMLEWNDAVNLIDTNTDTYVYWLADGRSIRKDWQSHWWRLGASVLPLNALQSLGSGGVVLTFSMLVIGVILVFWNWIPSNQGGLGLRIGSSLLLCLLLGLSYEWMPQGVGQDLSLKLSGPAEQPKEPLPAPPPQETESMMKDLPIESIQLMLVFLGIQVLIFIWSCIQLNRISKSNENSDLKIKLLENEDMLFDMGLYIGLGGTVLSLIFMVMGHENQGLIAAYTSTLFGILEVAIFKIFILRPFKQKLIVGVGV